MGEMALQLTAVKAGYGATQVLQGIDLTVKRGERVAIMGRNGVGKTTTLSMIMGLTRLHSGSIRLDGTEISTFPPHRRARLGIGLVPQTRDIFPSLSVEENLLAGQRDGHGLDEAYTLFPRLKERRHNGGAQLSGGEQQMLSIARTLMGGPRVLLLDEPLEGLAPVICDMLIETFERLAASGDRAIVLVEQHAALALSFAERAVILDAGRVVFQGTTTELRDNPTILDRHIGMAVEVSPSNGG